MLSAFGFRHIDLRFIVEHLPMEIAYADFVIIHESYDAYSSASQIEGYGRA